MIELHDDDLSNYGCVFELGGGKDGLMYPASGTSPALVLDTVGTNHGVVTGATLTESDTALSFDGVDDNILLTTLPAQNSTTIIASVYFNYSSQIGMDTIFSRGPSAANFNGIWFVLSLSNLVCYVNTTTAQKNAAISHTAIRNAWGFVALVINDATKQMFVRLNETKSTVVDITGWLNNVTGNAMLGRYQSALNDILNGKMKNVCIYNTALSDAQLDILFADHQAGRSPSIATNLLAYYPLNQANCRSSNILDTAGNNTVTNNDATLTADHNGRANRAWALDGVNDSLDATFINALFVANHSYFFKFKWDGDTAKTLQSLFSHYKDGSNSTQILWTANTLRVTEIIGGTGISRSIAFTDTNWHTLAVIRNSGVLTCYLDLTEMTGSDAASYAFTQGLSIGKRTDNTRYFDGSISVALGSTVAWSLSDVKKLINYYASH